MVRTRFAKANNPLVGDYDKVKPNSWLMYLDANNFYGWAMSQALPTGEFEWVSPSEAQEVLTQDAIANQGDTLEVDLEYIL